MNLRTTLFLLPRHNGQRQNVEVSRVEVGGTHVVQAENIVSINRILLAEVYSLLFRLIIFPFSLGVGAGEFFLPKKKKKNKRKKNSMTILS